jgi:hypothetical protein
VNPEHARLIARGADDASIVGSAAADDHRLAAELRSIALLDGREERVQIDVEDGSRRRLGHLSIFAPRRQPAGTRDSARGRGTYPPRVGRWSRRDRIAAVSIVAAGMVTWWLQAAPSDPSLLVAWRYPAAVVGFLVVIYLIQTGRTMAPFRLRPPNVPDWSKAGPLLRAAVMRAQREAIQLDHNYVGTEHLLLGLLADPASQAGALLAQAGVHLDESRERIEKVVGRGDAPAKAPLGLTPRSARAIEFAFGRVPRGGQGLVDDRHLLEGVLAIEDGLGAWLVTEAGCSVVELRRAARNRS